MGHVKNELTVAWGGIDFVFLMTPVDFTEGEKLLSRRMMKYWANFARHGWEHAPQPYIVGPYLGLPIGWWSSSIHGSFITYRSFLHNSTFIQILCRCQTWVISQWQSWWGYNAMLLFLRSHLLEVTQSRSASLPNEAEPHEWHLHALIRTKVTSDPLTNVLLVPLPWSKT